MDHKLRDPAVHVNDLAGTLSKMRTEIYAAASEFFFHAGIELIIIWDILPGEEPVPMHAEPEGGNTIFNQVTYKNFKDG